MDERKDERNVRANMEGEWPRNASGAGSQADSPPKTWNKAKRAVRKPKRFATSPEAVARKESRKCVAFAESEEPCTPLGKRAKDHVQSGLEDLHDKENACPSATNQEKSLLPGVVGERKVGLDLLLQVSEQATTPAAKATTPSRPLETNKTHPDTVFSPNTMAAATTVMQLAEKKRTNFHASKPRVNKSSKRALLKTSQASNACTQHNAGTDHLAINPPGTSTEKQEGHVVLMPGFGESSFAAFLDFLAKDMTGRIEAARRSKIRASECMESLDAELDRDTEAYQRAFTLFQCTQSGLEQEIQSLERRINQIGNLRNGATEMGNRWQSEGNKAQHAGNRPLGGLAGVSGHPSR